MFLFLCNFFFKKNKLSFMDIVFFKFLVFCILIFLDKLEMENRIYYVVLVLLMVNGNKLLEEMLDNDVLYGKKWDFLKKCKVF